MHPFRLVVIGGTGFGVLAMLLPFASFPVVGAVDGLAADAWPALIPLLLVVLITLVGRWDLGLDPLPGFVAVTACAASLVFAVVKITDALLAVRATAGASMGPGSFVLAAAILAVTGGATAGLLSS